MANLIIEKVTYSGQNYSFESPQLASGINIIVGDNGSGKSTFSYLIEYGLGGSVPAFKKETKIGRNDLVVDDVNNFVKLDISINNISYTLKRFIGFNDILVEEKDIVLRLPISRNEKSEDQRFSDWLLDKLSIEVFSLSMGTYEWMINFNDLYRLLNYDQDTETSKIYKKPAVDNFISDSIVIRKAIFETLIGASSQEYNHKFGVFKEKTKKRDEIKALLTNFIDLHGVIAQDKSEIENDIADKINQIERLNEQRIRLQKKSITLDAKVGNIEDLHREAISLELEISQKTIKEKNIKAEIFKIESLIKNKEIEIEQILKIVYTHDKLDLFSLEICPFCGTGDLDPHKGFCICGSEIKDTDYEKFVYKSSEYKDILSQKRKSLESIFDGYNSFQDDINCLEEETIILEEKIGMTRSKIVKAISQIQYSDNSEIIDQINEKLLGTNFELQNSRSILEKIQEEDKLKAKLKTAELDYNNAKTDFEKAGKIFHKNNEELIKNFSSTFSELIVKSSCNAKTAEINEDYMPVIDGGAYRERSALVPIRLMYYFTFFYLGLINEKVRHPHLLIIDTPDAEGIDPDNLKQNLAILKSILDKDTIQKRKDYQVILTSGYDKYPKEFTEFIRLKLNKKEGKFIFNEKI